MIVWRRKIGEPYFIRHVGLLIGRMEIVRHFISEGWKMSDSLFRELENVRKFFDELNFPKVKGYSDA